MKRLVLLVTLILVTLLVNGQEYNKWTIDLGLGVHSVSDESASEAVTFGNYNAGIRYNFSETYAFGLRGSLDNMPLTDFDGVTHKLKYNSVHLESTINIFNILDLKSNFATLLFHVGPGLSFIHTDNDYSELVASGSVGATGVFKIVKNVALKLDVTTIGNLEQSRTLDGSYPTNTAGISSLVNTASVGLVLNFGTKKSPDFYIAPVQAGDTIINNYNTYPTKYVTTIQRDTCVCDVLESHYVFFDHDNADIRATEMNVIYKTYTELKNDEDLKLVIYGWASPTSSTNQYNLILSQHRSQTVYNTIVELGIDEDRISYDSFGKDFGKQLDELHPFARRVELLLRK